MEKSKAYYLALPSLPSGGKEDQIESVERKLICCLVLWRSTTLELELSTMEVSLCISISVCHQTASCTLLMSVL